MVADSVPCVTLNSGERMPLVGFGLWKIPKDKAADQVYNAIKTGYRLLDGAAVYGNEKEAGEGLKRAIDEGIVKREDVFVTSKLWSSHREPERVQEGFERSLKDWGLDYIDLYLIHWPYAIEYVPHDKQYPVGFWPKWQTSAKQIEVPLEATWVELEKLYREKKAKSIGVCNFRLPMLKDFVSKATVKPAALQMEHHPYLQQEALVSYAFENKMAVTAYSSLGGQSYIEMAARGYTHADDANILGDQAVIKIAEKHKKTPAQVLLRWSTQRGVAVIPKSNNQHRLEENLQATGWDLTAEDLNTLKGLEKNFRINDPKVDDPALGWLFAEP